jgi:cytochrome c peroxidase
MLNASWPELLARLGADPDYVAAFRDAYPEGLSQATLLDALVSFQKSLVTPNARFDRYLRGDREALTPAERRGYQLFKGYGCVACHQGMNVGGNMFQKFGIFPVASAPQGSEPLEYGADPGRYAVTEDERDRGVFRVPSLRNVAVTAPYFHDGGAPTLEYAVTTMARVQLGRTLSAEEIGLIVRFLRTLTGEYQGTSLTAATEEPDQ